MSKRHEDFQQKMEDRAAERQRIKEEREARRRQQEQDKFVSRPDLTRAISGLSNTPMV
jgi:hypothetical protein